MSTLPFPLSLLQLLNRQTAEQTSDRRDRQFSDERMDFGSSLLHPPVGKSCVICSIENEPIFHRRLRRGDKFDAAFSRCRRSEPFWRRRRRGTLCGEKTDGLRLGRNNLIGFLYRGLCFRRAPVRIPQIKKRHLRCDADHLTLLRLSPPCDPGLTRCSAACVGWFLPVARSSWREEERGREEGKSCCGCR